MSSAGSGSSKSSKSSKSKSKSSHSGSSDDSKTSKESNGSNSKSSDEKKNELRDSITPRPRSKFAQKCEETEYAQKPSKSSGRKSKSQSKSSASDIKKGKKPKKPKKSSSSSSDLSGSDGNNSDPMENLAKTALASMSNLLVKRRAADNDSELMERRNSGLPIFKNESSMQHKIDVKKEEAKRGSFVRPSNRKPTSILIEYTPTSNSDMTSSFRDVLSKIGHKGETEMIEIKPPSTITLNLPGALKGRTSLNTITGSHSNVPSVNFMPTNMAGRQARGAPSLLRKTLIQNQSEFHKLGSKSQIEPLDPKREIMHKPTPPLGGPNHVELKAKLKSGFKCLHGSIDSTTIGFTRFGGMQGNMPCSVGNRNRV